MGGEKEKRRTYTVATVKLALALSELEQNEKILRVLANSVYGVSSAVNPAELLHCLADVLGGHYPGQLEEWIEGKGNKEPT